MVRLVPVAAGGNAWVFAMVEWRCIAGYGPQDLANRARAAFLSLDRVNCVNLAERQGGPARAQA